MPAVLPLGSVEPLQFFCVFFPVTVLRIHSRACWAFGLGDTVNCVHPNRLQAPHVIHQEKTMRNTQNNSQLFGNTIPPGLATLGWSPFFQEQYEKSAADAIPARIVGVHKQIFS